MDGCLRRTHADGVVSHYTVFQVEGVSNKGPMDFVGEVLVCNVWWGKPVGKVYVCVTVFPLFALFGYR